MLASSAIDRAPARVWAFSTIQLSARLALGIVLALFAGECVMTQQGAPAAHEFIRAGRCWPSTNSKAVPRITTAGRKADATIESASTQLTQSRGTIPAWRSLLKCTCVREHQRWCSTDAADTSATRAGPRPAPDWSSGLVTRAGLLRHPRAGLVIWAKRPGTGSLRRSLDALRTAHDQNSPN